MSGEDILFGDAYQQQEAHLWIGDEAPELGFDDEAVFPPIPLLPPIPSLENLPLLEPVKKKKKIRPKHQKHMFYDLKYVSRDGITALREDGVTRLGLPPDMWNYILTFKFEGVAFNPKAQMNRVIGELKRRVPEDPYIKSHHHRQGDVLYRFFGGGTCKHRRPYQYFNQVRMNGRYWGTNDTLCPIDQEDITNVWKEELKAQAIKDAEEKRIQDMQEARRRAYEADEVRRTLKIQEEIRRQTPGPEFIAAGRAIGLNNEQIQRLFHDSGTGTNGGRGWY